MTSLIRSEWQTGKGKARVITTALDVVACLVMWGLLLWADLQPYDEILVGLFRGLAYAFVVVVFIGAMARQRHGFFAALKGNFTRACLVTLVLFVTVANAYS